jgi:hypothetical protein
MTYDQANTICNRARAKAARAVGKNPDALAFWLAAMARRDSMFDEALAITVNLKSPGESLSLARRIANHPHFAQISAGALAAAIVLSAVVLLRGGV